MTDNDADAALLDQIARRNWIVLALLLVFSLPFGTRPFILGVLAGGLVAIVAWRWLHRSLKQTLAGPEQGAARRFKFNYFIRLATLAVLLYGLIAVVRVHPIGLAVGLSVVVLNLLWTTLRRIF